jgi:hypothetical protein
VQRLDLKSRRPAILTSPTPCQADDSASPEALDMILGEIIAQRGSPFTGYRIETSDRFCHEVTQ